MKKKLLLFCLALCLSLPAAGEEMPAVRENRLPGPTEESYCAWPSLVWEESGLRCRFLSIHCPLPEREFRPT